MSILIEVIAGIICSIGTAVIYKVYRKFKKKSLCCIKYNKSTNEYIITKPKQEKVIQIHIDKLENTMKQKEIKLLELKKSLNIYTQNKINTILGIELNDITNQVNNIEEVENINTNNINNINHVNNIIIQSDNEKT